MLMKDGSDLCDRVAKVIFNDGTYATKPQFIISGKEVYISNCAMYDSNDKFLGPLCCPGFKGTWGIPGGRDETAIEETKRELYNDIIPALEKSKEKLGAIIDKNNIGGIYGIKGLGPIEVTICLLEELLQMVHNIEKHFSKLNF